MENVVRIITHPLNISPSQINNGRGTKKKEKKEKEKKLRMKKKRKIKTGKSNLSSGWQRMDKWFRYYYQKQKKGRGNSS